MQIWFECFPNLFKFILFYLQNVFTYSLSILIFPIFCNIYSYFTKNWDFIPLAIYFLKSSWPNMLIYAYNVSLIIRKITSKNWQITTHLQYFVKRFIIHFYTLFNVHFDKLLLAPKHRLDCKNFMWGLFNNFQVEIPNV